MGSLRAPMLPAPLQFIVEMIAYAINQRMARQLDYLQEVRVLKEALTAATGNGYDEGIVPPPLDRLSGGSPRYSEFGFSGSG